MSLEGGDVGGLAHRVDEKARGDVAAEALLPYLLLDRGIAFETRHRHQIQEISRQLGQFGNSRLDHDGADGGVDAHGEIVEGDLDDVASDLLRPVRVIGEGLEISDQDIGRMRVLQLDAGGERARVVSEVQGPGGPVAGENGSSHGSSCLPWATVS